MFPSNNQNSEHSPGPLPSPSTANDNNIDTALVSPATKKSLFKRSKEDGMDRYVTKLYKNSRNLVLFIILGFWNK